MPNDLPEPTTALEMYLAAILAELRAHRPLLTPPGGPLQADDGRSSTEIVEPHVVELREPKKVVKRGKR